MSVPPELLTCTVHRLRPRSASCGVPESVPLAAMPSQEGPEVLEKASGCPFGSLAFPERVPEKTPLTGAAFLPIGSALNRGTLFGGVAEVRAKVAVTRESLAGKRNGRVLVPANSPLHPVNFHPEAGVTVNSKRWLSAKSLPTTGE